MQFIGLNRAMSTKQLNTELIPESCMFCDGHYVNPIMLPCLHSCCRECALYNSICKTCDELYYENGILGSDFPNNLLLRNITAIQTAGRVYKEHNETIVCKNCCLRPISNATNFCVDCQVFICNVDISAHLKFGSGKHTFILLTELNTSLISSIVPSEPYIGCPNHPLVHVKYLCTACDKYFCDDCAKMYHTDHPTVLVKSFIEEKVSNLGKKVKEIRSKFSEELYDKHMEGRQKLEDQKFQRLEEVHRHFDFLVEKINQRRNTLVYSIISQHDERIKLLQSVYERNEMLNEKTKECLDIVEQYTVTYPSKYILPLALTLSHRLDDFTFHDHDMDLDIGKVEYNVNGLLELAGEFDKIGHVDPIRRPKLESPIASYPKNILKSGWSGSDTDHEQITLVTTTVTMFNYLLVVFKTQTACTTPATEDINAPIFKATIIDPYSPTRNLCHSKQIDVKSVTNLLAHKNRCTYLVDRVGKQLLKLDDMLSTVQIVSESHILEDPVCISFDKTNAQFLVYNLLTNNVNRFDMSLTYLGSFDIPFPMANRLTRSNSDIHKLPPVSPKPKSKQNATNTFFPEIIQPSFSDEVKLSINLTVNSKETVFYVPNSKQMLYVLDKGGNILKEISLKLKINEEEISSPIQKLVVEKPTNQNGTLGRSRKRSNSNPKRTEPTQPPRERIPNFTTFVCVNASDTLFIHQNNTLYIFNPDLELVVREQVPESFNPKSMNIDFFGHIFYTTEENIILC
ncbi:hypothetical protein LOD99_15005 [Oopsacas minuta]|uniref:B box-type domain-containing protein n=1 Tax=Oopsacas minuta TaxID=111878 RepID=A0AAV7KFF6_9METZ|nr:hypothetical protein LOD99_15005 [Oopsacas minuta]